MHLPVRVLSLSYDARAPKKFSTEESRVGRGVLLCFSRVLETFHVHDNSIHTRLIINLLLNTLNACCPLFINSLSPFVQKGS